MSMILVTGAPEKVAEKISDLSSSTPTNLSISHMFWCDSEAGKDLKWNEMIKFG